MAAPVRCGKCGAVLPAEYYNLDHLVPCPKCMGNLQVFVFPAYYRPAAAAAPEGLTEAGDATCYYHAENRAVVACGACGRFLCAVCQIDLSGQTLCPGCIHAGVRTRKLSRLENRRVLHDNVALAVATAPALMFWPSIITAPMAIFLAIRHWRSPSSLIPRTKIRLVLAILFAFVQLAFWGLLVYGLLLTRGAAV
jgi:hypothetical protein